MWFNLPCRNTDHGVAAGLTPFTPEIDRKEVRAVPNLLLVITGVCIIAYVVRETLYDLQKKMNDHDGNHDRSDKQG